MVHTCCIHGFRNKSGDDVKRSFYVIPTVREHEGEQTKKLSIQRRNLWLARINRKDFQPSKHSRVCSDHFISGTSTDLYDTTNPDWAPSRKLAAGSVSPDQKATMNKVTRYERAKARKEKKERFEAAGALRQMASFVEEPQHFAESTLSTCKEETVDTFEAAATLQRDDVEKRLQTSVHFHDYFQPPEEETKSTGIGVVSETNQEMQINFTCAEHTDVRCPSEAGKQDTGKKSNHPLSPDYVPSIFTHKKSSAKQKNTKALQKSEKRQKLKKRKRGSRKQVTAECAVLGLRDTDVTTPSECSTDSTELSPEVADLKDEGSAEALDENEALPFELQCRILRKENRTLKEQLKKYFLCPESFSEDNDKVEQFTGLPTYGIMMVTFQFIRPYLNLNRKFSPFRQFLLTCMHLRLNLNLQFLAFLFSISLETASRVFSNTCDVMFCRLVPALVIWPDRKHLRQSLPVSFQQNFEKCCCIIDCFEIFQEKPSDVETPRKTCSQNKSHNSSKYLIGIAPQGAVCFVSQGWDGHCSDEHITEHCGFLDELLPGDLILADRGFDGGDAVGLPSANVNISAFTRGTSQMSALDVEGTRALASARIHVERVIGMVRQKYTILSNTVPISLVHSKDNGITSLDKIVHICCALTNLSDPMILFE
ncbi:uncharacterized protein LOC132894251 isoform X1 [Neoarius graeffei]|uniref:uncharacterized protein LOC132894251 isoform X1 n=1 Tax=Neoarius graeffei TaxID=443677 RepID=UPI00298C11D3|nr:uncharacterized protein LOC132894251 isoform X1 [Neoarius graeffei]